MVQLNKAQFYNNVSFPHEHGERISDLQFSDNSAFLITISPDVVKIWKMVHNLLSMIVKIPGDVDKDHEEDKAMPLAAVNNKATMAATYRGKLQI